MYNESPFLSLLHCFSSSSSSYKGIAAIAKPLVGNGSLLYTCVSLTSD